MEEIEDIIAAQENDASDFPDDEDPAEDSWTTEDKNSVVKQTDRHVFVYRETVLPEKVQEFFSVTDLQPGRKRKIVLWQQDNRFDAFIERTIHNPPLTRMRWGQDLALLVQKAYPEWSDFFKKSRSESEDTPSLYFSRRLVPDEYDIAFEGALLQDTTTDFDMPVSPGEIIDNDRLREIFRCNAAGTMRRSQKTNSLVLISDHTRPGCDDKWIGKTFHFTGIGLNGEPGLSFNQNKSLCESTEKGTSLYLFEVFEAGAYTYIGEVELADNPYLSRQTDSEKKTRDVTVFPLRLPGGGHPPLPKNAVPEITGDAVHKKIPELPREEPLPVARDSPRDTGRSVEISAVFDDDNIVSEYAKRRADGTCQLCNLAAPFRDRNGEPFLEIHHIVPLEEGGMDDIGNVAALCPNCHRKMHELNLPADVVRLRNRVLRE
jgi:5-methylcytosine-specific restriction enzyme A